ncbi:hypothetical protein WBG78_23075 [Chryseolinea sp. T2]|uniref:hypothetical protein n=1 Tax=Chryseolinea sp. T2 TaxID=3129255 RepID=UPI0030772A1C
MMNTDTILRQYWDIFISHTCEYYPLDKSFIEKYEYELDWKSLSKNTAIEWDLEFLKRYETRFVWHELAGNESILWTEDKIDHFKKRLDWHYLARNKSLPITDNFIQKYSKKLFVVENNPLLNKDLIERYNIRVLPANNHDSQQINSIPDGGWEQVLNTNRFHSNQKLVYDSVFLPIIENAGLSNIFGTRFDYSQRYYFLEPIKVDISGLTPEFTIDGDNPFEVFNEDRDLCDIGYELTLINGSLQEGPDRLYEVPRLSATSYYTTLLVSESVRSVLEQFKLPGHVYHAVNLKMKKLTTPTKYFILQIEHDRLVKDLRFSGQEYFYSLKSLKVRGFGVFDGKISNYEEYLQAKDSIADKHKGLHFGVTVYPNKFELVSDFDLYSYSVHGKFIVNQYVKDALEKYLPNQMAFNSAQLLNIKIDQEEYNRKSARTFSTKLSSKLTYQESSEDKYYFAKAERLEKSDPVFDKSVHQGNDEFSEKEIELNVIFPKMFKDSYVRKSLETKNFRLLPIPKFYIQNEYSARYPETFKSVVIAENGIGDSLNLILERDSDYKLQNRIFEFFHETGEYDER